MKTNSEVRLENLELLVKELGTLEEVARRADSTSVYLSQIRNGTIDRKTGKPRQMGNAIARRIEVGCGKDSGWMDAPHPIDAREAQGEDFSFQGRGGNIVGIQVRGGVLIEEDEFHIDPELGSGYVLGSGVLDGYAVRIIGNGRNRSLRDGQYLVIEEHGNPNFSDFCILETEPGLQKLVEVLGEREGRVTLEEVVSGERLSRDESDLVAIPCVVAVVSASRWQAERPDPRDGWRPRKKRDA
ncbi:hypothetical protein A3K87_09845 [Variovorax paradoxus]|uniref:Uncharacterized protein n=2 Tax=Variovorax paradoxus TaxID=34073 RepID=A0AA91ICD7_VARPD|nr:hypothetical protein A3K87_09845 [Variovorax paradoxus]